MKEQYVERITFGKEQCLNLGFGPSCPACGVERGLPHEYGRPAEECPRCGTPVIDCHCECLAPWDEFRITKAIEATFSSLDDAYAAGAGAGNRKADAMSYTDKAAVLYVIENVPPEMKTEINRGFAALFPGLHPCGTNEQGERMYSSVDIAKALEVDHDEITETISNLVAEDVLDSLPREPQGTRVH